MARIRTLKADFFTSPTIADLSSDRCRLTFAGLICVYVDDHGRGRDDARLIKAAVWPLRDDVTAADVAADLTELTLAGLVVRYDEITSGSRGLRRGHASRASAFPLNDPPKYLALPSWNEHQRVPHPAKSKCPPPPAVSRKSPKSSELFLLEVGSGSGSGEGKGSGSGTRERAKSKDGVHAHKPKTVSEGKTNGMSPEVRKAVEEAKRKISGGAS